MQTWEDGAARAAQLLIWELILQGTLSLVLLPYLEAAVSGQHLSQHPHVHLLGATLLPSPVYLFHLSEDPPHVSSKHTPELFLTPATSQQLLYQYRVYGHVLLPLWEPVWLPASQLLGLRPVPWS